MTDERGLVETCRRTGQGTCDGKPDPGHCNRGSEFAESGRNISSGGSSSFLGLADIGGGGGGVAVFYFKWEWGGGVVVGRLGSEGGGGL